MLDRRLGPVLALEVFPANHGSYACHMRSSWFICIGGMCSDNDMSAGIIRNAAIPRVVFIILGPHYLKCTARIFRHR